MEKNSGLIVFEKAMNRRFEEMAAVHGLVVYKADLQNNFSGNVVTNILKRLASKNVVLSKVYEIKCFIESNKIQRLYFSSPEGYISHNMIRQLQEQVPSVDFIGLQHGVFPLKYSKTKEFARSFVNYFGKLFFGIYPIGAGFGGIHLDAYYVYSDREREFLIKSRKWEENKVFPKLDFIKAELLHKYQNSKLDQNPNTALFLMQCLNLAGLTSLKEEKRLTENVINYLAKKYRRVLIKTHPACNKQVSRLELSENVEIVEDMTEGFRQCKNAYSFFSTALIDAKIFNLTTTGIYADTITVDKEIYENFDLKIDFEDIITNQI